jgi:copper chaperone
MKSIKMQVEGMSCGSCVKSVTRTLEALEGVSVTSVHIGSAAVAYDPGSTSPERIGEALGEAGYAVARVETLEDQRPSNAH